jgi:hypothetical protein
MTEAEMVDMAYQYFKNNCKYKEIVLEVPYLSRCIDMVMVNHDNEIYSIEFKLKNWRKAIEQAKDHKIGADYAYICIPKPPRGISQTLIDAVIDAGIGLMVFENNKNGPIIYEKIKPEKEIHIWYPIVESLKRLINRISGNQVFCLNG